MNSPRVSKSTVAPGNVAGSLVPGRRDHGHIHLVVHGPGPGQQLPVGGPSCHVEGTGEHQQLTTYTGRAAHPVDLKISRHSLSGDVNLDVKIC